LRISEEITGISTWITRSIKSGRVATTAIPITRDGEGWCVAAEGYDALGVPRPEFKAEKPAETEPRRTRANSKQAQVIALLRRPEGVTISQICEITGWQSHTVRRTIAGALKKELGLIIVSEKIDNIGRVYRVA
jgi:DNA-directed RNA polymerase specialized sigma24 family protein